MERAGKFCIETGHQRSHRTRYRTVLSVSSYRLRTIYVACSDTGVFIYGPTYRRAGIWLVLYYQRKLLSEGLYPRRRNKVYVGVCSLIFTNNLLWSLLRFLGSCYRSGPPEFTQGFGFVLLFRTTWVHPGFWVRVTVPDHLSSPRALGSWYRSGPPEFTQGFGFVLPFRTTWVHQGFLGSWWSIFTLQCSFL